jgi:hypothetical protein
MLKRSARQNTKKYGLNPSVASRNPKPTQKKKILTQNGWIAGGHAPSKKPSKDLAKKIQNYLKAIHKRD